MTCTPTLVTKCMLKVNRAIYNHNDTCNKNQQLSDLTLKHNQSINHAKRSLNRYIHCSMSFTHNAFMYLQT